MKSILSTALAGLSLFAMLASPVLAQTPTAYQDGQPTQDTAADLKPRTPTYLGCYSDPGDMINMGPWTFQSVGWCQALCIRLAKPNMALFNGTTCFCGDNQPPGTRGSDSDCVQPCSGINSQACGGKSNYAAYNDGYQPNDPTGTYQITIPTGLQKGALPQSTTLSSQVLVQTTIVTQPGGGQAIETIQVTQAAAPGNSGPNTVAIAVGVVVAVVVVAAAGGALFFVMRHRKNKALREERARHELFSSRATGEKPGTSYSMADSRLDQSVMFQRRMSDGSIMDNEDYSRRILKVANPDD